MSILDKIIKEVMAMPRTMSSDPFQKYNFEVIFTDLDALGLGVDIKCGFTKVSGLKKEINTVKYAEGGWDTVRNIPARKKFEDVTMETGIVGSNQFERLIADDILYDEHKRFTVIIKLKGKGRGTQENPNVRKWVLKNCLVKKWEADGLDANSDEVAMEKITIQYEEMDDGAEIQN